MPVDLFLTNVLCSTPQKRIIDHYGLPYTWSQRRGMVMALMVTQKMMMMRQMIMVQFPFQNSLYPDVPNFTWIAQRPILAVLTFNIGIGVLGLRCFRGSPFVVSARSAHSIFQHALQLPHSGYAEAAGTGQHGSRPRRQGDQGVSRSRYCN